MICVSLASGFKLYFLFLIIFRDTLFWIHISQMVSTSRPKMRMIYYVFCIQDHYEAFVRFRVTEIFIWHMKKSIWFSGFSWVWRFGVTMRKIGAMQICDIPRILLNKYAYFYLILEVCVSIKAQKTIQFQACVGFMELLKRYHINIYVCNIVYIFRWNLFSISF